MAGFGAAAASSKMGVILCVVTVLVLGVIAGMVIISLISTFPSNHSSENNGEEYKCPAIMLKSIYTSTSDKFTGGSIADNPTLSTLSSSAYRAITGEKYLTGCIVENSMGYGPWNNSITARRRRQTTTAGLYSIGDMRCFYSNPCAKKGDQGKYATSSGLSSCVKNRLKEANSVFTKNGALTEWTPKPNSLAYNIVNTVPAYVALSVQRVFGVQPTSAVSIAQSLGVSQTVQTQLANGCMYVGQLSHSAISSAISNQYTETTTAPVTTVMG